MRPLKLCEQEEECPTCLTLPGEPCISLHLTAEEEYFETKRNSPHRERWDAWAKDRACAAGSCVRPPHHRCERGHCPEHHRARCIDGGGSRGEADAALLRRRRDRIRELRRPSHCCRRRQGDGR